MTAESLFSKAEQEKIEAAIKEAELNTSGEIRVHIENHCKTDVMDRASEIFAQLDMHKTQLRNGVLIYLAIKDRRYAVIGDVGINQKVDSDFWDSTKELLLEQFKIGAFTEGLRQGILKAGSVLKTHFPYQSDDVNELSDDISFGND
jgi:uncharacterized membrane protein